LLTFYPCNNRKNKLNKVVMGSDHQPQYTEYEVSIDSKEVFLWFTKSSVSTVKLNLELKSQVKISKYI
jgi:hypothetical protein